MTYGADLFGGQPRMLERIELTLVHGGDNRSSLRVAGWPENRRRANVLIVNVGREQSMGHALGLVLPLLHQHWMPPQQWRHAFIRIATRLGEEGYEVSLL